MTTNSRSGKNVILLHLESISRANLWQFRNELGTVWRLMSQSLQFNRFFSSATSTTMAVTDLYYGDSSGSDLCPLYQISRVMPPNSEKFAHLGVIVQSRDYDWYTFHADPYRKKESAIQNRHVFINDFDVPSLCEKALRQMAEAKRDGRRFFAYFWDDSPHLAFPSPVKDRAGGVAGRLRTAYALADASLNRLLAGLAELGLWDDTIIVGFGDHGDEPWSHGLNRGYCHSLAPYASLTWAPMFIFDPGRFQPGIDSRLASMVDLKPTLLGLLFPDDPPAAPATLFAGLDLFRSQREFAFSQNMFALQREYSDPEQGMVKGYAVTDGAYRLVVSSGGRDPDHGGMEFYCDQADPANSLNLLKFFKLDRHGEISRFHPPPDAVAKYFPCVFGSSQVESLRASFRKLKSALREFVKDKEAAAMAEYDAVTASAPEDLLEEVMGKWLESYRAEVENTRSTESGSGHIDSMRAFLRRPKPDPVKQPGLAEKYAAKSGENLLLLWERDPRAKAFLAANPEIWASCAALAAGSFSPLYSTVLSNREA
ncbi:MAG: sulfatase-like hydrolase/transferase, partial [Planctomycetota bacterium]|nr:sulfatase-like hydrolase/transferase [Planctomycetota bacterium]